MGVYSVAKLEKRFLPLAAMEKLLKEAGADRVSDGAKVALKEFLEEISIAVGREAVGLALHAGRKTIKAEDIKLAAKNKGL